MLEKKWNARYKKWYIDYEKSQQIREPLMPDSKIENYNDGKMWEK